MDSFASRASLPSIAYYTLNDVGIYIAEAIAANNQSYITDLLGFRPNYVAIDYLSDLLIAQGSWHWTHISDDMPFLDHHRSQQATTTPSIPTSL